MYEANLTKAETQTIQALVSAALQKTRAKQSKDRDSIPYSDWKDADKDLEQEAMRLNDILIKLRKSLIGWA